MIMLLRSCLLFSIVCSSSPRMSCLLQICLNRFRKYSLILSERIRFFFNQYPISPSVFSGIA